MADEEMETNSPFSTSEATPPQMDDSPEMISQPSPPEEQRVTSSTDRQELEVAESFDRAISSTTDQEPSDSVESLNQSSADDRFLLETNEARAVEGISQDQSSSDSAPEIENQPQPDAPSNPTIRRILESPLSRNEPNRSISGNEPFQAEMVTAAFKDPMAQLLLKTASVKDAPQGQAGSSQATTKLAIKQNVDEENSEDSEQQFDVEEISSISISSPENMDLGSDSSPTGLDAQGDEQRDSGSRIGENVGLESNLGTGAAENVGLESNLGTGAAENVESEPSPINTCPAIRIFGSDDTENVKLETELSPSKKPIEEEKMSISGTVLPPKRKSPTRVQHLSPKKSALLPSHCLQKQSDSHMSTLIDELDIKETGDKSENTEAVSRHGEGKSGKIARLEDSQKEETEQERDAEVQETDDSQKKQEEM